MWKYNEPLSSDELRHHGILGQKWGIRRYQNSDGSLTPKGIRRHQRQMERKDNRWLRRNDTKITNKVQKASSKELNRYAADILSQPGARNKNGKLSSVAINAYNRKMAELMSQKVSDIRTPSGKVVQFVAKRGEVGVFMAVSTVGYDITKLKNGIYGSGRVAYKKTVLDKIET